MADTAQSQAPTFWTRLRLVALIGLGIVLAALGGIGVALGLMQSPTG